MAVVFDEAVEFKLKEKVFSLSEDSFKIVRSDNGAELFSVKGNALSLRDSKKMYDAEGKALFKMTEALLTLRSRMFIEDQRTGEKYTLRKKGYVPLLGTSTIHVWKGDSDDGEPWLEVKGDILRKSFSVNNRESGERVAKVKRKALNLRNMIMDKQTYYITVEPKQDAALLVFLVVAIDEQYRDDNE